MEWLAYRPGRAASVCTRLRAFGAALLIGVAAAPDPAAAQKFSSQGPGPQFGNFNTVKSADASPNGTDAGAVQAVLLDPALGAGTLFAGSPNGGIWKTTNGGTTWTALTGNQASLSISSLSLDPMDPSGKTIIAGIGAVSNGTFSRGNQFTDASGALTGLLYTADGGRNWSALGGQNSPFADSTVVNALARGSTMLVATYEVRAPQGKTDDYGLFLSTDGGSKFNKVSGTGSGLPLGAVSSLVADPSDPNTFYAAVKNSHDNAGTSVYVSHDKGATWTSFFTKADSHGTITSSGDQTVITLAAGPNGSVAVAVSDLAPIGSKQTSALAGVFLWSSQSKTWTRFANAPDVVSGLGQTPINLHIAIDPNNQNMVYLAGDTPASGNGVQLYRVDFSNHSKASLTFEGTSGNNFQDANTAHSDSRSITFDKAGNLILSSDGGIYMRTNPAGLGDGTGGWSGLNGNLAVFEGYAIAYDANSKRVGIAAQDNGVALQSKPGSAVFNPINGGDGTNIAINDRTLSVQGRSAVYSSSEQLGSLSRLITNAQGQVVGPDAQSYDPINNPGGIPVRCTDATHSTKMDCAVLAGAGDAFFAPFVLNRIDPSLIAIGGKTDVFTTQDTSLNDLKVKSVNLFLTDLGQVGPAGLPTAISYGTVNNPQALAVGAYIDPKNSFNGSIWFSSGGPLTQLTNYAGFTPTGIVFDNRSSSRLFVADAVDLYYTTNADTTATFTKVPSTLFPAGFTQPTSLEFISNNGVNALLVGGLNTPLPHSCTLGTPNGCVISSTQSPITVADSDINGGVSNWRAFGQGLPNALVYTMAYNPTVDVLAVSSIGASAYVLYDVTSYFPQATVLQFGLADNNSAPDASFLTNGNFGSRPLIKYGMGTLTIAGDATYTGSTTINAGTLEVDGSIASSSLTTVNGGAKLTGAGTVGATQINSGGLFAPGNGMPGSSMMIAGDLAFQSGDFWCRSIQTWLRSPLSRAQPCSAERWYRPISISAVAAFPNNTRSSRPRVGSMAPSARWLAPTCLRP
jgi:autotransporter-associated beta strand protein